VNAPGPEVSVVIPTRNRQELLAVALSSALGQRDISLEVIVVDDASGDGTQGLLAAIEDPRVTVLTNEVRGGVSAARNRGIAAARGDWIAFLDDDDRWLPTRLRETVDCGRAAGADFVYGATTVVDENGRRLAGIEIEPPPPPERLAAELRTINAIAGPSSVIVSAELLGRTGGFDEEIAYLADWELWHRLAESGKAARCAQPLVEYMQHPGGMLLAKDTDILRELRHLRQVHPGVDFDQPKMTNWYAFRFRQEGHRWRSARYFVREAFKFRRPRSLVDAGVALLKPWKEPVESDEKPPQTSSSRS
jgi:glycosyltransferase involved in cell wall biosynthesis